jgi:isopentenyl-diphosphate Delta-isomerase
MHHVKDHVVLVDAQDRELGTMEKLAAHRAGAMHRAFSVFVFDRSGRLLLQRRAMHKYHSGGIWSNTCCSHPRPGEPLLMAAQRRLSEEMGFVCDLRPQFSFTYRVQLAQGLWEHELDHVFFGECSSDPRPDLSEVLEWRYIHLNDLEHEITAAPDRFSYWLRACFAEVKQRRPIWAGTL